MMDTPGLKLTRWLRAYYRHAAAARWRCGRPSGWPRSCAATIRGWRCAWSTSWRRPMRRRTSRWRDWARRVCSPRRWRTRCWTAASTWPSTRSKTWPAPRRRASPSPRSPRVKTRATRWSPLAPTTAGGAAAPARASVPARRGACAIAAPAPRPAPAGRARQRRYAAAQAGRGPVRRAGPGRRGTAPPGPRRRHHGLSRPRACCCRPAARARSACRRAPTIRACARSWRRWPTTAATLCCTAERRLQEVLEGGCRVPIGALAHLDGATLTLDALVASEDGDAARPRPPGGPADDPAAWASGWPRACWRTGAGEILAASRD